MQFFDRFYREVVGLHSPVIEQRIDHVRGGLGNAFLAIFDERLTAVDRRLIEAPDDIEAKVDFVTIYHMVIEGMLGVAGQRGVAEHLERKGILPGLSEAFGLIERDEHRHVAYGTWFLAQVTSDQRLADRVRERLAEVVPFAVESLKRDVGPNRADEVSGIALTALRRRLGLIGISLDVGIAAR
jgi:ribonucleoside-diphosphate reductase beta chain